MTDPSAVRPAPMEGRGAYNRSSSLQAAGLLPAVALFEEAAKAVALASAPQAVVIADYGSSQGHNSLLPVGVAIAALRQRVGRERAICVAHTDLPGNDFSALFQVLATDPDSYLRGDPAVFPSAVGRSYFDQILPSESVTLGWSSWAIQWLSRVPAPIPDQVQVAYSRDRGACEAYARQASADWRAFLAARSREMRQGARLVVLTMATDDAGEFGYRPLLEALFALLEDMTRQGFITSDELGRMAIPTVARSRADFAEPFADHGRFADLSIERLGVFHGEDRIWSRFEADGDAHALGAAWAAFSRASVFPTLAAELRGGQADPRSAPFVAQLEASLAARLAAAPARLTVPLAQMVLVKNRRL